MSIEFIRGSEASGKTTRCVNMAQEILDSGGSVFYVDGDISLDPSKLHTWLSETEEGRFLYTQMRDSECVLQLLEDLAPKFDRVIIDGVYFAIDETKRISRLARESDTAVWITKRKMAW